MRFSLQDVKKQVHRRKGELAVSLHFLRPGESQSEIERLVAYYERLLGQPQRAFSREEAHACAGDYRLADCLIATLSAWYSWQGPSWEKVMQEYGDTSAALLEIDEITSPTQLRLALYSYVNEQNSGFVDSETRTTVLERFAALYHLRVAQLEYLLALDSEDEAVLVREANSVPTAQEVATLYNQWVFEAALFNASQVRFLIDCAAFEQESNTGSGVGALIKRLGYLARKRGVYYDISYDEEQRPGEPGYPKGQGPGYPRGDTPTISRNSQRGMKASIVGVSPRGYPDTKSLRLRLTLYGPQEMTGAAQQYGLRLAQLCRLLLGYRQKTGVSPFLPTLPAKALLEAEATIHFLQRAYTFAITPDVLALLPTRSVLSNADESGGEEGEREIAGSVAAGAASVFDSSIEHFFAGAFASLEASSAVDGWSLIREPEPLLLEHSIFIPDFALTRESRRIYMEILGFWTPAYRERKVQKLQQLQGRDDIALAIPLEAKEAFAAIAQHFPIVYYHGQLSAGDILQMLRTHFDDLPERLASIDTFAVRQQVLSEGWIAERACYTLLHCYRRSELAQAVIRVTEDMSDAGDNEDILYAAGIGLYTRKWIEHLRASFVEWLGSVGVVPLTEAFQEVRMRWPQLAQSEDTTLEALFSLWPEVQVRRSSIFDATIAVEGSKDDGGANERDEDGKSEEVVARQAATKKVVRERKASYKKRSVTDTEQGDLWG